MLARALHAQIEKHVEELINIHGETPFYKDQILNMVKESMKATGSLANNESDIDLEVNSAHLAPCNKEKGKYILKSSEDGPLDQADKHLLDVFDMKLRTVKENVNNIMIDFSTWQTTFGEQKRTIRDINRRLGDVEEQKEELDLEIFAEKGQITASDVAKAMQTLQADILHKTVSQNDIEFMREHINDIERNQEKMLEKTITDLEISENIAKL